MRVWRINEHDWVAGPTLLSALRGARKQTGCSTRELIDRKFIVEVLQNAWTQVSAYDEAQPDNIDLTLADVVAANEAPGLIMRSEEWPVSALATSRA